MTPLLGFAPDLPPTVPGVITDCTQFIPTERGMGSAPQAVDAGVDALAAECRGAVVASNTAGTRRTIAGTQTELYELSGTSWTAVGASTITGSSESRWSFAQFGDYILAANGADPIQGSNSGNFTAVSGAPTARIVVAMKDRVIAFDTNDGTYGDRPDGWWVTGFQDATDWAVGPNNGAVGRLVGVPGPIVAAAPLGEYVVAYKTRGMYLGRDVTEASLPEIMQFDRVVGEQGCVGPEAVVDIGGAHLFVGEDNIWLYDGTRAIPIAQDTVRQWFFDDLNATYKYRTIVTYDRNNGRVWIFYPGTTSTGNPDSALVYHLASKRWGRANRTIEAAFNYVTPGLTWDTLSSVASTWDTLPDIPWDSQSWQAGGRALAVFNTSHDVVTLTGSGEDSGFTTGDLGDDRQVSSVNRVWLRFFTEPTAATITGQVKSGAGATAVAQGTGSLANSKFDVRQSGRWHRFSFLFTGNVEVEAMSHDLRVSGNR